jgi:DnaK suppressor protein
MGGVFILIPRSGHGICTGAGFPQRSSSRVLGWLRRCRPGRLRCDPAGLLAPDPPPSDRRREEGHAIMASTDLGQRCSARLPASPVGDLPQWRDRLEQLWRSQVEEIIELSLAFHEAASACHADGQLARAGPRAAHLQRNLARTGFARYALTEIEAAIRRIDAGRYGLCEQCGLRLRAGWLETSPQIRYCPGCSPYQGRMRPSGPVAGSG